jgi:aminoglycoside phosphotransferase (APT) family kinase protein
MQKANSGDENPCRGSEVGEPSLPDDPIAKFLLAHDLVATLSEAAFTMLTGGVASNIWRVDTPKRTFVVKKALPQLRVAQLWNAPVSRNASEVDWLLEAGRVLPDAVPTILASDAHAGIFAMSFFDPARFPVWKHELRAGKAASSFAGRVGHNLATIHASTAGSPYIAHRFANDKAFHSLRIEPYLEATARLHADLAEPLFQLASDTLSSKYALVHGDVSPKNILVGPNGPVFLDAECAWFGEPAFDLAFCLNHFLLKCLWVPSAREVLLSSFDELAASYLARVDWESSADIEARASRLLPALLLARVDGKSPVEYIDAEVDKDCVRRVARRFILSPPLQLLDIRYAWAQEISQ